MTQELNREPTIEELAKELEMEPEKVEYVTENQARHFELGRWRRPRRR